MLKLFSYKVLNPCKNEGKIIFLKSERNWKGKANILGVIPLETAMQTKPSNS